MQNLGPESTKKELPGELNPAMTWADQFLQVTGSDRIDSKETTPLRHVCRISM